MRTETSEMAAEKAKFQRSIQDIKIEIECLRKQAYETQAQIDDLILRQAAVRATVDLELAKQSGFTAECVKINSKYTETVRNDGTGMHQPPNSREMLHCAPVTNQKDEEEAARLQHTLFVVDNIRRDLLAEAANFQRTQTPGPSGFDCYNSAAASGAQYSNTAHKKKSEILTNLMF